MFKVPEKYNVSTMLDANLVAGRGEKNALVCGDERVTYSEFLSKVCRLGNALTRLGVRRGERIILVLGDTPIFPVAFFGSIRIGAVPCPINPLFKEDDYRVFVEEAGASVIVTDAVHADKVCRAFTNYPDALTILAPTEIPGRTASLDEVLAAEDDQLSPADTHRDDMAFWLYSGGTTGRPKAVMHTHQDIPWTCETYARHIVEMRDSDVSFARVLFHAYGLGGGVTFPVWAGATTILYPHRPTPAGLLEVIKGERPSLLFLVPTLYAAILDDPVAGAADLGSLRRCISAAETLSPEIWRRWRDKFGLEILDGLGSTEMLHIFCSSTPGAVRPGSSGKPVPGYDLRLVDDAGLQIAYGNVGTLQVRGPSGAVGYWRQRAKTQATMLGEWISTGDRYRIDGDGFYWFEGRTDDLIKIGGEWVSAIAIEKVLVEHEAVREAVVVGVTVNNLMRLRAAVVLAANQKGSTELTLALQAWCKSHLQRYQYPHLIDYLDDLPRTSTGKVQRFLLRKPAE